MNIETEKNDQKENEKKDIDQEEELEEMRMELIIKK